MSGEFTKKNAKQNVSVCGVSCRSEKHMQSAQGRVDDEECCELLQLLLPSDRLALNLLWLSLLGLNSIACEAAAAAAAAEAEAVVIVKWR